jgi:hypothetical protein
MKLNIFMFDSLECFSAITHEVHWMQSEPSAAEQGVMHWVRALSFLPLKFAVNISISHISESYDLALQ